LQFILIGKTFLNQERAETLNRFVLGVRNAFSFRALPLFVVRK